MNEAQARKHGFTNEQKQAYEEITNFVDIVFLNGGVDTPELEEVLDVIHDEWLEDSTDVQFDEEFESIVEGFGEDD